MDSTLGQSIPYIDGWLHFRYEQERPKIPGFVVALSHKGKIVFNKAYGYANLERKEKMSPDHIFRIASHSKTFSATAIMQLAEQGKLRIDDPVSSYIPWLKKHRDPHMANVTIRQILSHSAGIIRDGYDAGYWQLHKPFPDSDNLRQIVLSADLIIGNNTKMKYSNIAYSLIGNVIEAVSDKTFNAYVTDHITRPLGLKHTGPEYTPGMKDKFATPYTRAEGGKPPVPIGHADTRAMAAATGCYATAADLCRFFTAHAVGSGKLLSDESKKEMQRPQWEIKGSDEREYYGLGVHIRRFGERYTIGHSGGFPGFITRSAFDTENQLAAIVLTNSVAGPTSALLQGIFLVLDQYEKHGSAVSQKLSPFVGRYINLWDTVDIVAIGDKLFASSPETWQPFSYAEELAFVDKQTLKITKASGFSSEGELVRFTFGPQNIVRQINYAGHTMLPEAAWRKKMSRQKTISPPR
jgi:D-alanyl-D-alanine carboxypeptidase